MNLELKTLRTEVTGLRSEVELTKENLAKETELRVLLQTQLAQASSYKEREKKILMCAIEKEKKLSDMLEEVEKLKKTLDERKKDEEKQDEELEELEMKWASAQAEAMLLSEQLEEKEKDCLRLTQLLQQTQEHLHAHLDVVRERKKYRSRTVIKPINEERERHKKTQREREADRKRENETIQREMESQKGSFTLKIKESEEEILRLQTELHVSQKSLLEQQERSSARIAACEEEYKLCRIKQKQKKKQLEEIINNYQLLESEHANTKRTLNISEEKIREYSESLAEAQGLSERIKIANDKVLLQNEDFQLKIREIQEENLKGKEEIRLLQQDFQEKKKKLEEDMEALKNATESQKQDKEREMDQLKKKIDSLETFCFDKDARIQEQLQLSTDKCKKYQDSMKRCEEQELLLQFREGEHKKDIDEYQRKFLMLETEKIQADLTMEKFAENVKKISNEKYELAQSIENYKQSIESMKNEHLNELKILQHSLHERDTLYQVREDELNSLRQQITEETEKNIDLSQQLLQWKISAESSKLETAKMLEQHTMKEMENLSLIECHAAQFDELKTSLENETKRLVAQLNHQSLSHQEELETLRRAAERAVETATESLKISHLRELSSYQTELAEARTLHESEVLSLKDRLSTLRQQNVELSEFSSKFESEQKQLEAAHQQEIALLLHRIPCAETLLSQDHERTSLTNQVHDLNASLDFETEKRRNLEAALAKALEDIRLLEEARKEYATTSEELTSNLQQTIDADIACRQEKWLQKEIQLSRSLSAAHEKIASLELAKKLADSELDIKKQEICSMEAELQELNQKFQDLESAYNLTCNESRTAQNALKDIDRLQISLLEKETLFLKAQQQITNLTTQLNQLRSSQHSNKDNLPGPAPSPKLQTNSELLQHSEVQIDERHPSPEINVDAAENVTKGKSAVGEDEEESIVQTKRIILRKDEELESELCSSRFLMEKSMFVQPISSSNNATPRETRKRERLPAIEDKKDQSNTSQKSVRKKKKLLRIESSSSSSEQESTVSVNKNKVVVCITGITDQTIIDDLTSKVIALSGTMNISDRGLDHSVTHVISPQTTTTIKSLISALTNLWLVTPDWIIDSAENGFFLPEHNYGKRQKSNSLVNKKFLIDPSFLKETNIIVPNVPKLIELGRGQIVKSNQKYDYILVGNSVRDKSDPRHLTAAKFVEMILRIKN
eukprot:TRINITY_DN4198_c0_g1_i2.p1 TRINITY_DN4198_c0_g1~~TRINITY_DN4198_c0_g1_i2.p1  ORF type:complete len:1228 (-),score=317.37 TRINITY_DN4198_c0_g1_i2:18-3623(-)